MPDSNSMESVAQLDPGSLALPASASVSTVSNSDLSDVRPEGIALPSSTASSFTSAPAPSSTGTREAAAVPLPPSTGTSTRSPSIQVEAAKASILQLSYFERVRRLAQHFPHLDALDKVQTRGDDDCSVRILDFHKDGRDPGSPSFIYPASRTTKLKQLRYVENTDGSIKSRLVIVEDLSRRAIELLGGAFDIDPEFFASHLLRSGQTEDPSLERPQRWITNGMPQSYKAVRWYRQVGLTGTVARWLKDPASREALFDEDNDEGLTWLDTNVLRALRRVHANRPPKTNTIIQKETEHHVRLATNVFRRNWPLSTRPEDAQADVVPTAWAEVASIFTYRKAQVPIVVLLVDPLPRMTDNPAVFETRLMATPVPKRTTARRNPGTRAVEMFHPSGVRMPLNFPINKLAATDDHLQNFTNVTASSSTADAIVAWLHLDHCRKEPMLALVEVIAKDASAFLDSLEACLNEIGQDSLDDYLMSNRLTEWRQIMHDFELMVPDISASVRDFVGFVYGHSASVPARAEAILTDIDARTEQFAQKIEKAYNVLRAEMGVLESRRSIAEAETVTKLTELAFIFIPLTFCSGLFSMQIHELQNGVPLRTYVITSIVVFAICLGARLILRSKVIAESSRSAKQTLWEKGKLRPGSKIPTRTLVWTTLRMIWARSGPSFTVLVFILASAFVILPIAFLWREIKMDFSLNFVLSILLVPLGLGFAWVCASAYSEAREQEYDIGPLLRTILRFSVALYAHKGEDGDEEYALESETDSEGEAP